MKKSFVIICCAIAVVLLLLGGLVGVIIDHHRDASLVGVYRCTTMTLAYDLKLSKDGSCRFPDGDRGTWKREGDKVVMTFKDSTKTLFISKDRDGLYSGGLFFEKIG